MKTITNTLLIIIGLLMMSNSCKKDDTNPISSCAESKTRFKCLDAKVVKELKDVSATVVFIAGGYSLCTDTLKFSENLLVLCQDVPQEFKLAGKQVIVSGHLYNCCELLVLPDTRGRGSYGCLFEATSIKQLSDK